MQLALWSSHVTQPDIASSCDCQSLGKHARNTHRVLVAAGEPVLHVSKNWASWLVFCWVNPLMARGSKRQLQASDLFHLPKALLPSTCSNRLWGIWADVCTLIHSVHHGIHGIHAHVVIAVEACGSALDGERLLEVMGQMCQLLA